MSEKDYAGIEARPLPMPARVAGKRGYSRAFTPGRSKRVQFGIGGVPPALAEDVRAKCKAEGISLRALVLGWLRTWTSRS